MAGLTQQLAEFIASLRFEQLPPQAVETAKRGSIDCVGVLFAGRDEPVVRLTRAIVRTDDTNSKTQNKTQSRTQSKTQSEVQGEAQVLFDRGRASAADAALVNGTAAHALDYDDVGIDGHPSVVLTTAVLAEGERVGAGGAELIAAYVAGYETWAELSMRDPDRHHGKGWHPTAVFGAVAAAAAAARLAHLDPRRTANALGIAGSMAAGLVANFGSMTKPFQVGRAIQSGLLAARLAASGMTASADALEHRSGFLHAVSPAGRVRTDGEITAGRDWHILRYGINIKRYPVCYATHRSIDAVLAASERRALKAEDIEAIDVAIGKVQAGMLREHSPSTALDAKFSIEFALASAIVARKVGLAQLNDAFVNSASIRDITGKVHVSTVEGTNPDDPMFSPFDRVKIRLRDGTQLDSGPVHHARGHSRNPVSDEDLRAKFMDCTAQALAPATSERLFGQLLHMETLPEVAALYRPDR